MASENTSTTASGARTAISETADSIGAVIRRAGRVGGVLLALAFWTLLWGTPLLTAVQGGPMETTEVAISGVLVVIPYVLVAVLLYRRRGE